MSVKESVVYPPFITPALCKGDFNEFSEIELSELALHIGYEYQSRWFSIFTFFRSIDYEATLILVAACIIVALFLSFASYKSPVRASVFSAILTLTSILDCFTACMMVIRLYENFCDPSWRDPVTGFLGQFWEAGGDLFHSASIWMTAWLTLLRVIVSKRHDVNFDRQRLLTVAAVFGASLATGFATIAPNVKRLSNFGNYSYPVAVFECTGKFGLKEDDSFTGYRVEMMASLINFCSQDYRTRFWVKAVLGTLIPLLFLIVLAPVLVHTLRKSANAHQAMSVTARNKRRASIMMAAIAVVSILTEAPRALILLYGALTPGGNLVYVYFEHSLRYFILFNSIIKFSLGVLMNSEIRRSIYAWFKCLSQSPAAGNIHLINGAPRASRSSVAPRSSQLSATTRV